MKKLLLTAAAVVLFTTVNAQTKFGVKAGYSLSKLNSDENLSSVDGVNGTLKSKSGFYIGALVEHKLTNKFALQGEVQYANLGGKAEVGISGITVVENFNLNRIVIPVAAKYYATPELGIYAGPFVSFRTNTNVNVKVKGAQSNPQALSAAENYLENAFDNGLKSSEFGLFFGAEYNAYKGLFFDARYSFGLSNMIKDPVYDEKMRMNFLQIGVGYKFK
jgi:opacity protein-like surface antigen